MSLYGADLARIHADGFGELASKASPELVSILSASSIPVRRIYDIGCGAGVTTCAMVAAGFETIAVDASASLLAIARTNAPGATFLDASVYDLDLERCDALLAIGEVLTYHAPDEDAVDRMRAFFREAARAVVPGGRLLFDLIDADGPSLDAKSWRTDEGWVILWETREDRATSRLTRHIETFVRDDDGRYRHTTETHHVRLFGKSDVVRWLAEAGFSVETAPSYGAVPLAPRRVAFVATRT